jgi:hypothetical protein
MTTKTQVRDLARYLWNVESDTFGLLKCDGVMEVPKEQDVDFVLII